MRWSRAERFCRDVEGGLRTCLLVLLILTVLVGTDDSAQDAGGEHGDSPVPSRQVATFVIGVLGFGVVAQTEVRALSESVLLREPDVLLSKTQFSHVLENVGVVAGKDQLGSPDIDVGIGEGLDDQLNHVLMEARIDLVREEYAPSSQGGDDRGSDRQPGACAVRFILEGEGEALPFGTLVVEYQVVGQILCFVLGQAGVL